MLRPVTVVIFSNYLTPLFPEHPKQKMAKSARKPAPSPSTKKVKGNQYQSLDDGMLKADPVASKNPRIWFPECRDLYNL